MKVIKSRKSLITIVLLAIIIGTLLLNTALASSVVTYITKVAGIPVSSDYVESTTTVPPNTKVLNVKQSGQETINFVRVKVVDTNALLSSNNELIGFSITLSVKAPSSTDVEVSVSIKLSDGSTISTSNTYTLDPGTSSVSINLPQPVNPDDVVSVSVNASPK